MMSSSLKENIDYLKNAFDGSLDFVTREFQVTNTKAALISLDGMVDKQTLAQSVLNPILGAIVLEEDPVKKFDFIRDCVLSTVDQSETVDYATVMDRMMSGFAVLAIDGCIRMLVIGVQGFQFRSISEPQNEVMQRGSREGFVEPFQINISMIRRRMRTPKLKFERLQVGTESNTNICLCYLRGVVSQELLGKVKENLHKIELDSVMAAGYLTSYLVNNSRSIFSGVGITERPDTVCGKIKEGRIAIIVDGAPNVLILPHLFVENFQSFDDYANRPFYATFTRWLKYLAFLLALFLPGFYVSATTFHPELLPEPLLLKIAQSEASTPFPVMVEAIIIHIIYEIMREAGLRVPRPLSHAVSIVGALVIGDAAVNSGLIGAPTLMVIALTAIASYVIPDLYAPIAVLRLLFIIIGGTIGFWGIMLGFMIVLLNICSESVYKVPFSAPVSPFSWKGMKDVWIRSSWKKLSKTQSSVQDMPGSHLDD